MSDRCKHVGAFFFVMTIIALAWAMSEAAKAQPRTGAFDAQGDSIVTGTLSAEEIVLDAASEKVYWFPPVGVQEWGDGVSANPPAFGGGSQQGGMDVDSDGNVYLFAIPTGARMETITQLSIMWNPESSAADVYWNLGLWSLNASASSGSPASTAADTTHTTGDGTRIDTVNISDLTTSNTLMTWIRAESKSGDTWDSSAQIFGLGVHYQ